MTVESRSVVVRLSAETAAYITEMQRAGKVGADAMQQVEKNTVSASKAQDQLASGAGKVALAGAVALGGIVSATSGFDQAMSKVQAATHETEQGMKSLRAEALQAGADTAFSANEAAGGIEALAKAGVSTQDILNGGLTGALDLAAAGELGVADAAEAASGAMAQFNLDGSQTAHIADLLAAGAGKAQGDVSDMVLALKQAGTVSAQTGLSLEETVGALSAMAEQSLLGSDAGTSFKTMLAALTPNSEKAADAMAEYNIHAFDAQGNFVGMTALAGQLQAGLGELTDEQRAMALETIFGSDAVRAASIIYDNGAEGIAKWTSEVNDAGYAAETAAIKQDNLRGDLEKLGGAFQTALIGSGDGSTGFLRSVTQGVTRVVDAYTELPPAAQSATSGILAGATAVGGSIWVGSKLVRGIADTRAAFDSLEASGSKAGKYIKGIGTASVAAGGVLALAGALNELRQSLEDDLPGLEGVESRLIGIADAAPGMSVSLGSEFDGIGDAIDRVTDKSRLDKLNDFSGAINDALIPGDARDQGLRQATAQIEALDGALADLVSGGNADVAEQALSRLAEEYNLSGDQVDRLKGQLTGYNEALAGAANDTKLEAAASKDAAGATAALGDSMSQAAPLTKAQAQALKEARGQATSTATEFFNLGDSLDDSSVSLGDWISELEKNAEALENFTVNAKKAAKNGLRDGLIQELENAGTAGALRLKQLANASDEEIDRANRAWGRGQKAINGYIDMVVKVPGSKSTTLDLKAMKAIADLIAFRARLDEATRDRIFTITTQYKVVRSASDALPDRTPRRAAGGPVFGPGTGTSDDVPIWASNGEYVVKAAAVEKYGVAMFDRLNAMAYADGGKVSRKPKRNPTFDFAPETEPGQREINAMLLAATAQQDAAAEQAGAARIAEKAASDQLDAAQQGLDNAQKTLDATKQLSDGLRDSVASQFRGGLTGGGLAGLAATLDRDANAGSSMDTTLRALVAAGLDTTGAASGLYRELSSSEDLTTATELLAAGPEYIAMIESKYAAREAINLRRGDEVTVQAYGPMIAQQTAAVAVAQAQLDRAMVAYAAADAHALEMNRQLDQLSGQVSELAGDLADAINSTVRPGRNFS